MEWVDQRKIPATTTRGRKLVVLLLYLQIIFHRQNFFILVLVTRVVLQEHGTVIIVAHNHLSGYLFLALGLVLPPALGAVGLFLLGLVLPELSRLSSSDCNAVCFDDGRLAVILDLGRD